MNMPDGSTWEPDKGFSNSDHNNTGGGGGGSFQPMYGGGGISSSGSFGKLSWIFKPNKQRYGLHWENGNFQLNFTAPEIVGWEWISDTDGSEGGFPELADISWIHRPIDEIYGTVDAGLEADVSRGAIPEYLRRCGMCHNPEGQYWDHLAGWREAFWMNVIGIMGAADIGLMFATLPAKTIGTSTSAARLSSNGLKLNRHLYQLEKYGTGGFRAMQNGRLRYYGRSIPNRGDSNLFRMVREWNPSNGYTRTWFETLNSDGLIIQVRPEFGTGMKMHYKFDGFGRYLGSW